MASEKPIGIGDRRRFLKLVGGAAAGGALSLSGCLGAGGGGGGGGQVPNPLRMAFPSPAVGEYYFPVYPVLQDILREDGNEIDRNVFSGHMPVLAAYIQDEIDIAYQTPAAIMNASAEGFPIVAPMEYTKSDFFSLAVSNDIQDWSDLEGQTIYAHDPSSTTYSAARAMVEAELGDPDAVEYDFIIGSSNRVAALQSGQIDATTLFTIDAFQVEADGFGHVMGIPWDYDGMVGHTTYLWVVLETTLDEQEERIGAVLDVILQAQNQVYERSVDDIIQSAKETEVWSEYDDQVWERTLTLCRDNEIWLRQGITDASYDRFELAQDRLIEWGIVEEDTRLPADEVIDDRFF